MGWAIIYVSTAVCFERLYQAVVAVFHIACDIYLRDGLCSGAIASTNDKTTHSLVTPMFFKARFCNVSREFLRLHHLGAVVWDDPSP